MNKNGSSLIVQKYATTANAQMAWRMERQHRSHQTRKGCVYDISFHDAEHLLRGYGNPATTTKRQSIKGFLCILLLPIECESIQLESLLDGFSCPLSVSSQSRSLPIESDQQV